MSKEQQDIEEQRQLEEERLLEEKRWLKEERWLEEEIWLKEERQLAQEKLLAEQEEKEAAQAEAQSLAVATQEVKGEDLFKRSPCSFGTTVWKICQSNCKIHDLLLFINSAVSSCLTVVMYHSKCKYEC